MHDQDPKRLSASLMMGKKKLKEIKAEVAALLANLPGPSPREWLDKEIEVARGDPERDAETLEMLRAALEQQALKIRRPRQRRASARRG